MTITCRKIGKTPLDFEYNDNGAKIKGSLVYKGNSLISLNAMLSGEILRECDICCETFLTSLDESLELLISDGIYTTTTHEVEDVIEVQDGIINIEEILHSEKELIKSDYFVCDKCKQSDEVFEF